MAKPGIRTTDPASMPAAGKDLPVFANWPQQDEGSIPQGSATIPRSARSQRSARSSVSAHSTRLPGVRRPDSPLHQFFGEIRGQFNISAAPGYTGYIPARKCENVMGKQEQKINEIAKIITDVRQNCGQGAGQNPWGAQLHRPRIVGHSGFVPGRAAHNVHGLTWENENKLAHRVRDRHAKDLEVRDSYYRKGVAPPSGYNQHWRGQLHEHCGEGGLEEIPQRIGRWS